MLSHRYVCTTYNDESQNCVLLFDLKIILFRRLWYFAARMESLEN